MNVPLLRGLKSAAHLHLSPLFTIKWTISTSCCRLQWPLKARRWRKGYKQERNEVTSAPESLCCNSDLLDYSIRLKDFIVERFKFSLTYRRTYREVLAFERWYFFFLHYKLDIFKIFRKAHIDRLPVLSSVNNLARIAQQYQDSNADLWHLSDFFVYTMLHSLRIQFAAFCRSKVARKSSAITENMF